MTESGAVGARGLGREVRERGGRFGFGIDHAPSGHAAIEAAGEFGGVRVEIAHHGEDRHQARAPIPALQRAPQTAAGDGALAQWVETAVTIVGARRRWNPFDGVGDDERGDSACDARNVMRLGAIVAPERCAKAHEPHQPKPCQGIQPCDAVLGEWWAGRSTHGRASMRPVAGVSDRLVCDCARRLDCARNFGAWVLG